VKAVPVTLRLTSPSSMRFFSATTRSPALVERNHWATSDGVFPSVPLRGAKEGRTSEEKIYYERGTWHAFDVAVTVGFCSEGRNNTNICQSLSKDQ
jgi:hypothetical protein